MNRRYGSCKGSWDIKMMRYGSCRGSILADAKLWIGHMDIAKDPEIRRCWDMNPETWISEKILRYKDIEIWTWRYGFCRASWEKEIEIWIRKYGSCRGSWNIKILKHESKIWILQRILRYIWMLICGSGDMDFAEDPEKRKLRYGSGDMDLAEDPEIYMDVETWIRRHRSCK